MTLSSKPRDDNSEGVISPGFSLAARLVNQRRFDVRDIPQRSTGMYAWPQAQLTSELEDVWHSCREANWDGHGALPIYADTFALTRLVTESLPTTIPTPELGAEPDGQITLEWYRSPTRLLSVSVDPNGTLHYAATLGGRTQFGSEPFLGDFPKVLLSIAYQVMCL